MTRSWWVSFGVDWVLGIKEQTIRLKSRNIEKWWNSYWTKMRKRSEEEGKGTSNASCNIYGGISVEGIDGSCSQFLHLDRISRNRFFEWGHKIISWRSSSQVPHHFRSLIQPPSAKPPASAAAGISPSRPRQLLVRVIREGKDWLAKHQSSRRRGYQKRKVSWFETSCTAKRGSAKITNGWVIFILDWQYSCPLLRFPTTTTGLVELGEVSYVQVLRGAIPSFSCCSSWNSG